ncbi:MAG: nitrite transporter NirC [Nitrospinaceae bacterium]|nr:formate/nitrite transporter family protein [Nitrospinaceae bacterium]NIR55533.1 formate/nitrite transporter family protein [Nitrospinaceae bacterium]NIS85967.1 formate/nitrite transporter family protein [Nitrospinaceae bacterium]NIT82813.1 formate/nitrite transporter family protein [Nitrospinaceae bacterium]NIU45015.1 formate/nitrite transporter family protein [Nitrospinaceae bacterium]
MFIEEIKTIEETATKKLAYMKSNPMGYLVLSALAGIYVGFGIVLIFAIGGPVYAADGPFLKLIMGASFGIALSLVIFAGSELFTGNNMILVVGRIQKKASTRLVLKSWALCYAGNLIGSVFLAWLVFHGDSLAEPSKNLILKVTSLKMNAGFKELFIRGILCNWLVCLAVWLAVKAKTEIAKLVMIFWCLFAFISSGFEHCVANMTLLSLGLLIPHGAEISFTGMLYNLSWVTLGNIVGGALFVGMAYWFAATKPRKAFSGAGCESRPAELKIITQQEGVVSSKGTTTSTMSGR